MRAPSLRENPRLACYDYTAPGAYFTTIVAHDRACVFGDPRTAAVNAAGQMLATFWRALPDRFRSITIDTFVVMPNHFHGILMLTAQSARAGVSLGAAVGAFKSATTLEYSSRVREGEWRAFSRRLWQRNYYEHVIRNERDLFLTRTYIEQNPAEWAFDQENLGNV